LWELGYFASAYLGVMVMDVDPVAQNYGLPAGAYVDEVIPGYGAEAAGMLAQDIIIRLEAYEITSRDELTRMLRKFEPGQTVTVTVYRAGKEVQLQVTLDKKPKEAVETQPQIQQPIQEYPESGTDEFDEWFQRFMEDFFGFG
jgi:serine protease Do